jgi:hypothetical protein
MSSISKENIQEVISIPSGLSTPFKAELGNRILEEVRSRTNRGIDKNGKQFKGYSPEYKESLDFKIAGKSSTVNLQSTGDMLAELSVVSIGAASIVIGYPTSHEDAGKVQGNVTGEYGNNSPVTSRRDFIGLPPSIVNRIVQEMKQEPTFREQRDSTNQAVSSILSRFI